MWYKLSQADQISKKADLDMYEAYSKNKGQEKDNKSIAKDIARTFPKHIFFYEKFGIGQTTLFNVLKALSIQHEDTGYVQGMGYIAAVLLMHTDEERVFKIMNTLFINYNMKGYYLKDMPKLKQSFYVFMAFLNDKLPKVFKNLVSKKIVPTMYSSQWFMTLFTVGFNIDFTVRVFDVFFTEGEKILF